MPSDPTVCTESTGAWDPSACLSAHILYVVSHRLLYCAHTVASTEDIIPSVVGLSSRFPLQTEHVLSSRSSWKSLFDPPCFRPVLCVIWYNLTRWVTALLREWTTLNVSFSVFTQGEEKWREGGKALLLFMLMICPYPFVCSPSFLLQSVSPSLSEHDLVWSWMVWGPSVSEIN